LKFFRPLLLLLALVASLAYSADVHPQDLLRTGRADEAQRLLQATVQRQPNDAEAYNLLCRLYFQLELWDNALHMAEKAVQLAPDSSNYHLWLGRSAGRKAENSNPFTAWSLARRVRAEFERAVALDGSNLAARADLSEYYIEAPGFLGGDKKKARDQAAVVAAHDPALASYIFARIEEQQGKSDAERLYKKALSDSGNTARYWIELAYFYRRAGRMQDMQTAVYQALTAPRHGAIPEYDGAYLFLRTGRDFPNAVLMLRRYLNSNAMEEDGPAFRAHYMLGQLLEKQGDRKAAAQEYRAAVALASEYRPAQDALARVSR
jgi:tetratricopeptide (TPR) repeat protein